ncbi:hypothetical protein [Maioricimonas rarisocia]|uniref:hypothetical protein n=1 Tax=Maioricimonas rarisocia TaxID=2528026 RepID=UPI0011A98552|nr:hypothetical protein [Maioricimonas rarisocia]
MNPTTGRLLYDGKPMPLGASVTFLPIGDSGVATSGAVDEDGNLSVVTFENQSGLVAGEYRLVVYQIIEKEPDHVDQDGEIRAAPTDTFMAVDEEQRIPEIFSDRQKSPLTVTIEAGSNDLGTLDLKTVPQS